ncbi:hypothetical protein, partial [Zarconia navalis]|uniref:hypothetical protein n=1 Tax=Zarconia navalis TaxID=2992134 RepID=UPI0021F816F8
INPVFGGGDPVAEPIPHIGAFALLNGGCHDCCMVIYFSRFLKDRLCLLAFYNYINGIVAFCKPI